MNEKNLNELWDAVCYLQRNQVETKKKVERQTDIIEQIAAQDQALDKAQDSLNRKVDYHQQLTKQHLVMLHEDQVKIAKYIEAQNKILERMLKELGRKP